MVFYGTMELGCNFGVALHLYIDVACGHITFNAVQSVALSTVNVDICMTEQLRTLHCEEK